MEAALSTISPLPPSYIDLQLKATVMKKSEKPENLLPLRRRIGKLQAKQSIQAKESIQAKQSMDKENLSALLDEAEIQRCALEMQPPLEVSKLTGKRAPTISENVSVRVKNKASTSPGSPKPGKLKAQPKTEKKVLHKTKNDVPVKRLTKAHGDGRAFKVKGDSNGTELPLVLGPSLRIVSYGTIVDDKAYYSSRYILPVGFKSERLYPDVKNPTERAAYTSEILQGENGPTYRVVHESGKPEYIAPTMSSVWVQLRKAIKAEREKRGLSCGGTNVSGPVCFGLANPLVIEILKGMKDKKGPHKKSIAVASKEQNLKVIEPEDKVTQDSEKKSNLESKRTKKGRKGSLSTTVSPKAQVPKKKRKGNRKPAPAKKKKTVITNPIKKTKLMASVETETNESIGRNEPNTIETILAAKEKTNRFAVGQHVEAIWSNDGEYYKGVLKSYNKTSKKYKIEFYDDVEEIVSENHIRYFYEKGERVQAKWSGDKYFYDAKVDTVNDDGTYNVTFTMDSVKEEGKKNSDLRKRFSEGEYVQAIWVGDGEYYEAFIDKLHEDDTVDITFDDGVKQKGLKREHVRKRKGS